MSHISASSIQIFSNPSKIFRQFTQAARLTTCWRPFAFSVWPFQPMRSMPFTTSGWLIAVKMKGGDNMTDGQSGRRNDIMEHSWTFPSNFEWYWMPMHSWGVGEKEGSEVFAFEAKLRYHRAVSAMLPCVALWPRENSPARCQSSSPHGGEVACLKR